MHKITQIHPAFIVGVLMLICTIHSSPLMAAEPLEVSHHNGIAYVSGGISDSEQSAIKEISSDYNLELLMALKTGHYLADVDVRISDHTGNVVLETVSNGPFLLANLPSGTYLVEASHEGDAQQKQAYLDRDDQEQLNFYW